MKVATGAVVRAKLERINNADWRATGLAARAREVSGKGMVVFCDYAKMDCVDLYKQGHGESGECKGPKKSQENRTGSSSSFLLFSVRWDGDVWRIGGLEDWRIGRGDKIQKKREGVRIAAGLPFL